MQRAERKPIFRLGMSPLQLPAFNEQNIKNVPAQSGVYIIYEPIGPLYVGRSGCNIQRRLRAHLNGTGNKNLKLARKIQEVAQTLTFTYALVPKECQHEVESVLIADLGAARRANMRHEGMYEEQFED